MEVTIQLQYRNSNTGEVRPRTYRMVNRNYLGQIGTGSDSVTPITPQTLPSNYTTFWAWADAAARAINSLSNNTFVETMVNATWSTTEEMDD